jgi:hypothetical protein
MMKNIARLLVALMAVFTFSNCGDEDTEGLTRITTYPTIELEGSSTVIVDKGSTYEEPGYVSTYGGEDVSDQVTVSGTVDTNTSGIYTLTYTTMTNDDGFNASTTRTVLVYDVDSAIDGYWTALSTSYREYNGATRTLGSDYDVFIYQQADGTYYISDFFGGWYDQRAGYGSNYACVGSFRINSDNSITLVSSSVAGWGDSLTSLTDGVYDPTNNTITYKAEYVSGMIFNITLQKQ